MIKKKSTEKVRGKVVAVEAGTRSKQKAKSVPVTSVKA